MYEAKGERASHIYIVRVKVENGDLARINDDEPVSAPQPNTTAPAETPSASVDVRPR